VSIGDTLADARRQAGLTVTQVAQQTRIRETIIRGIERGDFSACGGDFYARGHIRSIAKVVGIDPDDLIREYDAAHGAPHAIRAAEVFEPSTPIQIKERRHLNWSVAMVVALAVIIGYVVYHAVSAPAKATPAAADHPTAHPTVTHHSAPPTTAPAITTSRELVIRLAVSPTATCWVEFTSVDGAYLSQATLQPGEIKTWRFKHTVEMQIGNPVAVTLTVNGKHKLSPGAEVTPVTLSFSPVEQITS
jgi:cytoskeletal protein RodZ